YSFDESDFEMYNCFYKFSGSIVSDARLQKSSPYSFWFQSQRCHKDLIADDRFVWWHLLHLEGSNHSAECNSGSFKYSLTWAATANSPNFPFKNGLNNLKTITPKNSRRIHPKLDQNGLNSCMVECSIL